MNWFNKHLNWTYIIFFIISIIVSTIIISKDQSMTYLVIASIASIIINLAAGAWVLWKKGQSLWLLAIIVFSPFIFLIIVLLVNSRNDTTDKKGVINDETYYKNRDKK